MFSQNSGHVLSFAVNICFKSTTHRQLECKSSDHRHFLWFFIFSFIFQEIALNLRLILMSIAFDVSVVNLALRDYFVT